MEHKLPELPYPKDSLAPHISAEIIDFHYGKHHQGYVNNLNNLIADTAFDKMTLEEIIRKASGGIFNNAAQVFNHTFYWNCLKPGGSEKVPDKLSAALGDSFGCVDTFKKVFTQSAITLFGSGWVWLIEKDNGALDILPGPNACCPIAEGFKPLLTCDVWEHAYYIDYRNNRAAYVEAFWKLVNWEFVLKNLG